MKKKSAKVLSIGRKSSEICTHASDTPAVTGKDLLDARVKKHLK